jgi:hypothetical protein
MQFEITLTFTGRNYYEKKYIVSGVHSTAALNQLHDHLQASDAERSVPEAIKIVIGKSSMEIVP